MKQTFFFNDATFNYASCNFNQKILVMIILQIEHPVPDYASWKKAFDIDPVNRQQSGVKRYRVFRQAE